MNKNIYLSTYEGETLLYKENTTCTIEDNILEYNTDVDNIKINLDQFSFIKDNHEAKLKLTPKDCTLTLKELNNTINIPLDYINYKIDNTNINIEYKLISQEQPIKINIEIGSDINEI